MTWFAVYKISNGRLRSVGTVVADPLPAGLAKKDFGATRPEGDWNTTTLEFDPYPPRRRYTVVALLRRFTRSERNAFRASTDSAVSDFLFLLQLDDDLDADDPGLSKAIDMLESKGIIGPGRAAEIRGE